LPQTFVALVPEVELEREAVRLSHVFREQRFHVSERPAPGLDGARNGQRSILPRRAAGSVRWSSLDHRSSRWLDHVMTATQRLVATGPEIVEQPPDVARGEAFLPRVVDHDDRRAVARAEAFDFDEREGTAG